MRYDAVIFDLDGTLTESAPGIVRSVRHALARLGLPDLSDETLRAFIGPPLVDSFMKYAGLSEGDAGRAVEAYRERFNDVGWRENRVYAGIPNLLRSLKESDTRLYVATGKPVVFAERILSHFSLRAHFDGVFGPELHERASKGALIARALDCVRGRAAMVGDRAEDVAGAKTNGIDSIGALWGYGSEAEFAGATRAFESVDSLRRGLLGDRRARGDFISFEGLDKCGKTTQIASAVEWLAERGFEVESIREPGGNEVSERIRDLVLNASVRGMTPLCEAFLFAAARAQLTETVIEPALRDGKTVLCDRYVDSSVAYQGTGRGLGGELVRAINRPATGGLMPDLTLYLRIDPKAASDRIVFSETRDRMELEAVRLNQRVYDGYLEIVRGDPERVRAVDATGSVEAVKERVLGRLAEFLAGA